MSPRRVTPKTQSPFYGRIRQILESAQSSVARSVNTTQVVANWMIGREIVEEEQKGQRRAGYGERLIRDLAERLQAEYGTGCNLTNLKLFRKFYLEYPQLADGQKGHAVRSLSLTDSESEDQKKGHAARDESITHQARTASEILHAARGESWQPGRLHPNLSWTHYRTFLRVDKPGARAFYEIEPLKNNEADLEQFRLIATDLGDENEKRS